MIKYIWINYSQLLLIKISYKLRLNSFDSIIIIPIIINKYII